MTDQKDNSSTHTLITVLLTGLIVAVIVQSYIIFGIHKKLYNPDTHRGNNVTVADNDNGGNTDSSLRLPIDPLNDDDYIQNMAEWNPFQEMQAMHDSINQMFGNAFHHFQKSDDFSALLNNYAFSPDINIEDKGDHYRITMDLPGVEDSRINVKVENQMLTVSGSSQSETKKEEKGRVIREERRSGNFSRTVTLPGPVDAEKMTTETKKGVLSIEIPKKTE